MRTLVTLITISGTFFVSSCTKEGCTDSTALNFNSKAKKDNGTCVFSNVKSELVTVNQNEWVGDGEGYEVIKSLSILNSEIASNGSVLCYWKDGDDYIAMPITYSVGSWVTHLIYTHDSNSITFISYDDDGLTPNPGTRMFKVVCVSHRAMAQNPGVDLLNYQEVKEAFELVD
jgi:hypothetical protein